MADPSFFIRGSINSVAGAAILGGLLAMLMVFLFLGSLRKSFVGGLVVSMLLTLFVVPCLYLVVSQAAERAKRWLTGREPSPA